MAGAVVLPNRQVQRVEAGDDVDVAVGIEVTRDDAHELIAGGTIDRQGEPGGKVAIVSGAERCVYRDCETALRR